ncbi:MAG: metal-sensing transcriptional repressor [Clostridia bacterium]|nr:metal-sensing transcriptional repressor [Clostridia bacterium]
MKADKTKVCRLLKTARGQIDGILKMIDDDKYCLDISCQVMAAQAILKKANEEILRAHLESCVNDAFLNGSRENAQQKIEELTKIIAKL